jgi:SAM-dependent methyltransferase
MDMNSPMGKKVLALVRGADYAHAGEAEAVDTVFRDVPKDPARTLVDVGCGRGGTAQYVQRGGWGRVLGVDIDSESIEYAKRTYPDVEFMASDAMDLARRLSRRFDIIYLFNAFYAIPDHRRALEQFHAIGSGSGRLIVFDYSVGPRGRRRFPFAEWNPLDLALAGKLFREAGWRVVRTDDLSAEYARWYRELNARIESASGAITDAAGGAWLDFVRSFYGRISAAIADGLLGGAAVYAERDQGAHP